MDLGLSGKVVLVTGASSGMGRATAIAFGTEAAHVAITYRNDEEGARRTEAAIRKAGGEARAFRLDLADETSIDATVAQVTDVWSGVDVLVNNAVEWPGFPATGERFETAPVQRFRRSLEVNLAGPYLLSRAVIGHMRARGWGRIVYVSTGLVRDGFPGSAAYVSAKAGLHGLARTMSRELASSGILTNVVMPGFAPGNRPVDDALIQRVVEAAATRRVTTPHEVARCIVFLCSAVNTNVTGEEVRVDGHFLSPT